ncbi:MAG: branched-chain amino acid ABC transporter permease [Chloroflexi bacterium]|nr:branched-chain amino acid ABC transporter permease [Chloroflexota bacterium]
MELPFGVRNTSFEQELSIVRTKAQWTLVTLGLVFFFTVSLYLPAHWLVWFITLGIYAVAALGLHVLLGLTGLFSMGHAAVMAVGAYTAAILGTKYGISPLVTLPLSGIIAGMIGACFAIPALRIRGFYLVMVTMAAQFIITWAILRFSWTGGASGMEVPDLVIAGDRVGHTGYWWLTLGLLIGAIVLVKNIHRTNTGRQFLAVRDNDIVAEVMGVNLFRAKLLAFFIGSFFAGVAGWLWAYFAGFVHADQFNFLLSMKFLAMLVVGGLGSTTGVILGCTAIMLTDKVTSDHLNPWLADLFPSLANQVAPAMAYIAFAALVLIFIIFEPRGLYYRLMRIRLWYNLYPFSY